MTDWTPTGSHYTAVSDALEALQSLPDGSLDAIIADPPYASGGKTESARLTAKSHGGGNRSDWFTGDAMTTHGYVWIMRRLAAEARRVLKPGGSLLLFADWRMVPALSAAVESAGLRWRNEIIWDKQSPSLGKGFRPQHETVAVFDDPACDPADPSDTGDSGKVQLFVNGTTYHVHTTKHGSVLSHPRVHPSRKKHPCEKPVALMMDLILGTTPPGGVICDPFCGSGSTGEAADRLGRVAYLSDWDAAHITTTRNRLSALTEEAA